MLERLASAPSVGSQIDPVSLEILWGRLISIIQEAETVLLRTSFSPIVGEANDYSAALLDRDGRLIAQAPSSTPGFIGILGHTTRTMLQHFPKETLKPGDVLITNDPWICCGHLNDINLLRPIFYQGKLVAFTANTAHMTDIGGRNSAEAVDLFEEGLRILPSKLYDAGQRNEEIYKFLRANTRMPIHIVGDLNAQLAATEIAERRLVELLAEYELDDVDELAGEIHRRTEQVMRDAIRRLPDGDYFGQVISDGYDQDLIIKAKVTIAGDALTVDFAGTSDQIDRAINCPMNLNYAYACWAIRAALAPDLPNADGALRPITVTAPEGSILNPRFPAPVYGRTVVVHNTHAAIYQALSGLVPDYLPPSAIQANSGCLWGFRLRGRWTEKTRPEWDSQGTFVTNYLGHGGQGAAGTNDGRHCFSVPANCANMPIEVVENRMPAIFLSKELRQDSGGAGRFRGGLGQTIRLRILSDQPVQFTLSSGDKIRNPANGLQGGLLGGNGNLELNGEPIFPPRMWVKVTEGDVVTYQPPGGGGFGDPHERDSALVLRDVVEGLISPEAARTLYGVAIGHDGNVDVEETARLRGRY